MEGRGGLGDGKRGKEGKGDGKERGKGGSWEIAPWSCARWYDDECQAMKRATRRLEKIYRRSRLDADTEAWRRQFSTQRQLYQMKFTSYWSLVVSNYQRLP